MGPQVAKHATRVLNWGGGYKKQICGPALCYVAPSIQSGAPLCGVALKGNQRDIVAPILGDVAKPHRGPQKWWLLQFSGYGFYLETLWWRPLV